MIHLVWTPGNMDNNFWLLNCVLYAERCGGQMVSKMDFQIKQSGFEHWPVAIVLFLGKPLYARSASLDPGVEMVLASC